MTVQFATQVVDALIAPHASALVKAEIPDMSSYDPQSEHWVANFFLNSLLRAAYPAPMNAYAFNYFRRAEAAFRQHADARRETLAFISSGSQSTRRYVAALFHWESFLGQAWHAFKLLEKGIGVTIYAPGSGAVEERLNHLYNKMKHVESRIACGQMLNNATVPVWLRCEGLESTDAKLSWDETAEVLRDVAKWAGILNDPLEAKKKLGAPDA
jgi:hypothetical protein